MAIVKTIGKLYLAFGATLLMLFGSSLRAESDIVNEKLSIQPLNNGDMLFALDLEIKTKNYSHFEEHMAFPGVLMDTLAPEFAKLFLRSHVINFEATQHAGEWKDLWGDCAFKTMKHGETLQASWSDVYTDVEVYDYFDTLAHDLWGITGSQFHLLTGKDVVMFDMTRIASLEDPLSSKRKAKNLMASYSEDIFCVDNLYKWRSLLPSLANDGLISIVNDERIWSKSPYKGVRTKMFYKNGVLSLLLHFQVVVSSEHLSNDLWSIYPQKQVPSMLLGVTSSTVEFLIPRPLRKHFNEAETISVDFGGESEIQTITETFKKLYDIAKKGFTAPPLPQVKYEVSELESITFNVLKRVQSSLSVIVTNHHNVEKYVKFLQPLPYWALPQLSSLTIHIYQYGGSRRQKTLHYCKSVECMSRTVYRERHVGEYSAIDSRTLTFHGKKKELVSDMSSISEYSRFADLPSHNLDTELEEDLNIPLVVFEKTEFWTQFGFSVRLPPNSTLSCRVDLQKNKLKNEEIDYLLHRGQLIHSGVLIESDHPAFDNISELDAVVHHTGEFFSYILLPDLTMSFNVMAAVGVIIGLLFGIVFNIATKRMPFFAGSEEHIKAE